GDGLAADFETGIGTSKLAADGRALYERPATANSALQHVPAGAVAVVGLSDLDLIYKSVTSQAGSTVLPAPVTEVGSKLTGDLAVEAEPEGQGVAFGAVVGTADPRGLEAAVRRLTGMTGGDTSVYFATSGDHLLAASTASELASLTGSAGGFESSAG